MKQFLAVFVFLVSIIMTSVFPVFGQQEKVLELKEKIETEKKEIDQLTTKEKRISLNLSQITAKLKGIKINIQKAEKNKNRFEGELKTLFSENQKINSQLVEKKNELEKRLIIWQKT
jgi:peptidoglycan hydrolase CwlO-like protein